jgi:hypothetical protein
MKFVDILPIKSFKFILRESKIDIIKNTNLKPEEKEEVIEFIKKYGDSAFKEFEWNKPKELTYNQFKKEIDTWLQNRSLKNNNNPKIFENKELFYFLHEDDEAWYYLPLSHKACLAANNYRKNADQSDNPDKPWCIGWDGTDELWDFYTDKGLAFVLQIKKDPQDKKDIKYMYQIDLINGGVLTCWNQNNKEEHLNKSEYIDYNAGKIYDLFFEKADTSKNRIKNLSDEDREIFLRITQKGVAFTYNTSKNLKDFINNIDSYRKCVSLSEEDKTFIMKLDHKIKNKIKATSKLYIPKFVKNLENLKNMNNLDFELLCIEIKNKYIWGFDDFSNFFESNYYLSEEEKKEKLHKKNC